MSTQSFCPEAEMKPALEAASKDTATGLSKTEALMRTYHRDPRLLFLRGSLLAQLERYEEARMALREALKIAPNYVIARFQLGLMELSGGDANAAFSTWGPLALLKENEYVSLFVRGLQHMVRDEFNPAIKLLRSGIEANSELPPLNGDMQMLIEEMEQRQRQIPAAVRVAATPAAQETEDNEPVSMTQFLLQQFRNKNKMH